MVVPLPRLLPSSCACPCMLSCSWYFSFPTLVLSSCACPFWLLSSSQYFSCPLRLPAFGEKALRSAEEDAVVLLLFFSFLLASSAASYTRSWTMLLQNRIRSVTSASDMFCETIPDAATVRLWPLLLLQLTSSAKQKHTKFHTKILR